MCSQKNNQNVLNNSNIYYIVHSMTLICGDIFRSYFIILLSYNASQTVDYSSKNILQIIHTTNIELNIIKNKNNYIDTIKKIVMFADSLANL